MDVALGELVQRMDDPSARYGLAFPNHRRITGWGAGFRRWRRGLNLAVLGRAVFQAGLARGRDRALACLLALNGLRISVSLGADIEHLLRPYTVKESGA